MDKLETLHSTLQSFDWFSQVGSDFKLDDKFTRVETWDQAAEWTQAEITGWCRIEAGNLLTDSVRSTSPEAFAKWNSVATSVLPLVESLMPAITAQIPNDYQSIVSDYVQSQLVGAFLEEAFEEIADLRLLRAQLGIYQNGLLPCGWVVDSPESFPSEASLVIF